MSHTAGMPYACVKRRESQPAGEGVRDVFSGRPLLTSNQFQQPLAGTIIASPAVRGYPETFGPQTGMEVRRGTRLRVSEEMRVRQEILACESGFYVPK